MEAAIPFRRGIEGVLDEQKSAESSSIFPEGFELLDARFAITDDAEVLEEVFERNILVGHGRVVLDKVEHLGIAQQGAQVAERSSERTVHTEFPRLIVGFSHEETSRDAPDITVGFTPPGIGGAFAIGAPVFRDRIGVTKVGRQRHVAMPPADGPAL